MKIHLSIISIALLLFSCDCYQTVTGSVIDATTKKPIDSVYVYKQSQPHNNAYTDTAGQFTVHAITGGLFPCRAMTVVVEKPGYQKQIVSITCGSFQNVSLISER